MSKSASKTSTPKQSSKKAKPAVEQDLIARPSQAGIQHYAECYTTLETLREIGIDAGSFVNLRGHIAIVKPGNGDSDTLEISKEFQRLCGITLGDRIRLVKATRPTPARKIVVATALGVDAAESIFGGSIVETGLTVSDMSIMGVETEADISKLSLQDGKEDNKEGETVLVTKDTQIEIVAEIEPTSSRFDGIGGLDKEINLLRSKIELPLTKPALFKRFGTPPEKGFLLFGPPGTGKTMLLKAIAAEVEAHVLRVNGPSIYSKYLGDTESSLRSIWEEATRFAPSLIFIDEIDALAPKRDSDESGETESRVVATLLTLMDGMQPDSRVVVVGATNRPNQLDPALRRPGRLGQELEIGIPDASGRNQILQLLMSKMPHTLTAKNINDIAMKTHGYVGADLQALVHDAVLRAIEEGIHHDLAIEQMFVTLSHVEAAVVAIRPSAMREITLEMPKVKWTDIGGNISVIQRLKETVEWPIKHTSAFERLGITAPRGVLLYGPPGCSKTLLAKALATETGLNFLAVKGPEIFNKYVGESERAVREVFRKARQAAPSIIFFDEIDALTVARGDGNEAGGDRVLTSLLNEMDGIESLKGVVILAATNRPDVIDSAVMRPGRLDRLIYVRPPDLEARRAILLIQAAKMAVDDDVDIDELAGLTEGFSGAEIVSVCQEAGLLAMNEDIEATSIHQHHFTAAVSGIHRTLTPEMLAYFENFAAGRESHS